GEEPVTREGYGSFAVFAAQDDRRELILLFPRHDANLDDLAADERDHRVGVPHVVGHVAPLLDRQTIETQSRAAAFRSASHRPLHFGERLADADAIDPPLVLRGEM